MASPELIVVRVPQPEKCKRQPGEQVRRLGPSLEEPWTQAEAKAVGHRGDMIVQAGGARLRWKREETIRVPARSTVRSTVPAPYVSGPRVGAPPLPCNVTTATFVSWGPRRGYEQPPIAPLDP